jgi:hypothetical protein
LNSVAIERPNREYLSCGDFNKHSINTRELLEKFQVGNKKTKRTYTTWIIWNVFWNNLDSLGVEFSGIFWNFLELSRIFRNFLEFSGIFVEFLKNFRDFFGGIFTFDFT